MELALYPYQQEAVDFLFKRDGCAGVFAEMGTGKTRMSLAYCARGRFRRILIVCPISVAGVWEREIKKLGLDALVLNATEGSIAQRTELVKGYRSVDRPLYIIINYESYWRMPLRQSLQNWRPEVVILDEAHRIKGRSTRQARFAHTLTAIVPHRLALTGTPVTNGLHDLYSMYKFIDPTVFGTRWDTFQDKYIKWGGFENRTIMGYKNVQEINYRVKQTSFQISKDEALDLPERTDVVVPVKLDSPTRKKYRELQKNAVAEIEGVDESGILIQGVALARIVLTLLLRLQQITSGFINTETGQTIHLSNEKERACRDLVDDALADGQQVVVFCRFLKDIERLSTVIPQSSTIYGGIPQHERVSRLDSFQRGEIRVLICQIQVASLGIDLTASNIGIFYSTGFSLTDFLQSRDRIHRHGQTRKVTYYHLVATDTVDEKVYQALSDKVNIASKVVDLNYSRTLLTNSTNSVIL